MTTAGSTYWQTTPVPVEISYISPGGSEIRVLPNFPAGEITHAVCPPNHISKAAVLDGVDEWFYVLEGTGQLWRAEAPDYVIPLMKDRCCLIRNGVPFQYRASDKGLVFLVAVAPRWQPDCWRETQPYWSADAHGREPADAKPSPDDTVDLATAAQTSAPDGSTVALLLETSAGGLIVAEFTAGQISTPVRHRSVYEIWYFLSGRGKLWRSNNLSEGTIEEVEANVCATIPPATDFQVKVADDRGLRAVVGTFPQWQEGEAVTLAGRWEPTRYPVD